MKPCILLIEDDQDMRDLVSGHLEHSGFDVQRAEDGIKGQALALQYSPDLIVLDLMLPKVDGLTLWLMNGKGACCSDGLIDAAGICEQLGINHHLVDSRNIFEDEVIKTLVEGYKNGITPLPCSK